MRRALAAVAVVFCAGVAVAGTFSGGFTFGDGGGLAGVGLGEGVGDDKPQPTFDLLAGATTPNDLPDTLTVNATSMTLALACDAQGADGATWTCRTGSGSQPLGLSVAGTNSPTVNALNPFTATDSSERSVSFPSLSKSYDASTSSVADVATDDFAVEVVGRHRTAGGDTVFDKCLAGTCADGFSVLGVGNTRIDIRTSSVTVSVTGPSVGARTWYHSIGFVDRNEASTNGGIMYTNGGAGAGVDVSSKSGSLTNAIPISIGGSGATDSLISSIRIWRCSGCFAGGATNPAQWAPIARQRAATAFGVSPIIARGTATPTTLTRATTAHVDVVDGNTRQLYLVGNNAPRVARRTSQGSPIAGYLSEPTVSNIALQSQTLETTWTPITVGDNVLVDTFAGADLTVTGDDIDGNNSAAEHGLRQSITLSAATHTFSAWARVGGQNFVALRNNTIANGTAWFDVATCTSSSCTIGEDCASAIGTVQAGVTQARAQRWPIDTTGDGVADVNLCRVNITYTGTAAAHNHDLLCAPSNGNLTYTDADATADCGFWGVRVEAFSTMTSYLATTTASVARNADDLRFDGASHYTGSPSTMEAVTLCPNYDAINSHRFISVGTSSTDYAALIVDLTSDRPSTVGIVTTTQWDIFPAADMTDGLRHTQRVSMETNNVRYWYDGAFVNSDLTATLPGTASSFVYFGTTAGTAAQSACLINRARLWSSVVAP